MQDTYTPSHVFKRFEMQYTQHDHRHELDNDNGHIAWLHIMISNRFAFIGCLLILFCNKFNVFVGKIFDIQLRYGNIDSTTKFEIHFRLISKVWYWKWFPFFWPNAFSGIHFRVSTSFFETEAYQKLWHIFRILSILTFHILYWNIYKIHLHAPQQYTHKIEVAPEIFEQKFGNH